MEEEKQSDADLYSKARRNLSCKETTNELLLNSLLSDDPKKARRLNSTISIDTELLFKDKRLKLSLVSPDDYFAIGQAYDLFVEFFVQGELIRKEAIVRKMHGLTKHFTKRSQYRLFIVKNPTNSKVIGARIMEQIPCLDSTLSDTGRNILYAIYIAVDKMYQGQTGIAKQLYISSLIDSVIEAEKKGKDFDMIIAECSDATENLQNSVGLKRVYFKNGIYLTELDFKQPYLYFDPMTGRSSQPAGEEKKEHFMLGFFDKKKTINKKDLEDCVRSLIRQYRSNRIILDFENKDAFAEYEKYFDEIERNIIEQIHHSGKLVTLSKKERIMYQFKYGEKSIITNNPERELD